jgi:pimeloyl-ACP methyl ester carboxylesterase
MPLAALIATPLFIAAGGALLIAGGALAIATPNPLRALKRHGHPTDDGIPTEHITLSDGSTAWLTGAHHPQDALAVCLAHGRSRDKSYLRPLIAALTPLAPVLAFDFPGHGERGFGRTSLGHHEAATVTAALEALAARYPRILCYGASMGGAATLLSQAENPHPAVQAIITDGTFATVEQVVQAARPRYLPAPAGRLALHLAGRIARYDPQAVRPVDAAGDLRVPLHVLHGDHDPLVPLVAAHQLAEAAGTQPTIYPGAHDQPQNLHLQAHVQALVAQYL